MSRVNRKTSDTRPAPANPCLCAALRQATRAVTRAYDAELRCTGLRATQHALLKLLDATGEVRQGDLGTLASLDETTLTRGLRPLVKNGWVRVGAGTDRREKRIAITESGRAKVEAAGAAWSRAQERLRAALPDGAWESLLDALPGLTRAASEGDSCT